MRALLRAAVLPRLVAISLMGLGTAGCADSGRFDSFSTSSLGRGDAGSFGPQSASAGRVETRPLPQLASVGEPPGAGAYQPVALAPAQPQPIQHRVSEPQAPQTRMTAITPAASPSRRGGLHAPSVVHVVATGETLNSIARTYRKPVTVVARANDLSVDATLKRGDRITIPDISVTARASSTPQSSPTPPPGALAMAEPSETVRIAAPAASPSQESAVKAAEPVGSLPGFRWPVRGRVIAAFGPKPNGVQNDGINLAVPEGTPIKAAEDGVVAYAGSELKGYGNLVLVRHSNGFVTAYAHASDVLVKRGETVKRGQVIAHAGQTGNVTSPQLHFEIRKGATPVDPSQYLSGA